MNNDIKLLKTPEYYASKYAHCYMELATSVAKLSMATRKKVGAVIYLNNHTLSAGFNGQPSGYDTEVCEYYLEGSNATLTCDTVIHAEHNAIAKVTDKELLMGAILFVTMAPCIECAKMIVNSGIEKVVYLDVYRTEKGLDYLRKHGILVEKFKSKLLFL